jgi:quercetin dioxygenase-like cupin family protein
MKMITAAEIKWEEDFSDNVIGQVFRQGLIDDNISKLLRISKITFSPGSRTRDHIHKDTDQIVYGISGMGVIGTDDKEEIVGPGTVVFIPAGEKHWHGSAKNMSFSNITFSMAGQTTHLDAPGADVK